MTIFPATPTPETAGGIAAEQLQAINANVMQAALSEYRVAYNLTWFNPDTTAQSIFTAFDVNGSAQLDILSARVDFITALAVLRGETFADQFTDSPLHAEPAHTISGGVVTIT